MIVSDTIWQNAAAGAGRAKYKALVRVIRDAVSAGDLAEGQKLPPVRELAYQLGVTPGTVARAYGVLTDDGVLQAEVGRGTFVAGARRPGKPVDVPLIYTVDEGTADFRSSRVPDVGQGAIIDAALIRLGSSHARRHINYPTDETDLHARKAVVDWIGPDHIGSFDADDVTLGNGAQPVILTEELAYPGARHAARLLRAKVVGVAMDDEGIIPDALIEAYRTHGGQVLLTAAEVHSPTTIKTSLARKQEIAAIVERFGLAIIEDDCHTTAPTDVPAYRALLPDQSYFVSSLTKSVSGALRFGFVVAPAGRGAELRRVAQSSFYGVAQPIIDLCADMMNSGDAARIRDAVMAQTAHRVRLAVNKLGRWDLRWREDAPFTYLQLPVGWRASGFAMACEKGGVTIRPADEFALSNAMAPNAVRLAVNTCISEERYLAALDHMDQLLQTPMMHIDG